VVEAGGRAERRVAVGFNLRFRRSWRTARQALAGADRRAVGEARLTMAFDTKRWRTAVALDREDAALAGLLEDVVPHQVDLLAFLFSDPIRRLRADELRFQRGRSIELLFTVEMGGGAMVGCRAAHGPWHAELLEAGIRGRRLVANPHGARWAGRAEGLRRRLADLGAKATHAGQRVTGRPTATSASFTAQLAAFALAVRDGQAGDLADGAAGLAAAAAGEALQASVRAGGGTWAAVEGREVG
jgi:predicted dehydrogenase